MPVVHGLRPSSRVVRRLAAALAIVLTAALGVWIIASQPVGAFAAPTTGSASAIQVGWTDSAKPGRPFDAGTANQPLGSSVDSSGTVHTSRVYGTYDINQFIGKHFVSASLTINETSALDSESGVSTVDARADGTATVTFQAVNTFGYQISVHSHSANGFVSPPGNVSIFFDPWAGVTSDVYPEDSEPHGGVGVTGTFTFTPPPGFLQVQEYRYLLPGASDFQTVPANPDNTASITFTPDVAGPADLLVYAVAPDGTVSDNANDYFFVVADS